jgi:hypothetical protein
MESLCFPLKSSSAAHVVVNLEHLVFHKGGETFR